MPLRVCFLANHAYPVIEPAAPGAFGGTEARAWSLARGLARLGEMEVSFVVRPRGALVRDYYDGVRIHRRASPLWWLLYSVSCRVSRQPCFPWLRVHRWSPSLVWELPLAATVWLSRRHRGLPRPDRFVQQLDSDVFCCFGVHGDSARAIASSKASAKKALLFLGSNFDLDPRYTADSTYVTPYRERGSDCWYALNQADRIVVQTEWQSRTLRERFGRESALLANPIDVAEWETAQAGSLALPEARGLGRYALWIGRADSSTKRPLLCLDVARRCPEVDFLMVVNPREQEIETRIRRECPPNVRVVDQVAYRRMPLVFRDAAVYVNTSVAAEEGFPNVLLQAAASAVPIASLEIDCGFVESQGCGRVAHGDLDRLAEYIRSVWRDPHCGREDGARGREYVRRHHDLPAKAAQLAALLREVSGRRVP